jgi:hypothetical protein
MVDFWCTLGSMVVDPTLLSTVHPKQDTFTKVPAELYEGKKVLDIPFAGHTSKDVQSYRDEIQLKLTDGDCKVTVGLYTAARFAQLKTTIPNELGEAINSANEVYKAAASSLAPSQFLRIALGVVLLDELARDQAVNDPDSFAQKFFLVTDDRKVIDSFAKDQRVSEARKKLFGPKSDWTRGCDEVYLYYAGFLRATL